MILHDRDLRYPINRLRWFTSDYVIASLTQSRTFLNRTISGILSEVLKEVQSSRIFLSVKWWEDAKLLDRIERLQHRS